ncbi:MAG TPA: glycerol-3-phosphate 1-O-acyltransferase [Psychromonas hadalis]|nr:glycerol-3-phosphate 1-O-acyltransferase [Psychromonas hadalis]
MLKKGSLLARCVNKYWVKSQYVPLNVVDELQLDLTRPIIYIVEKNSVSDLLGLRTSCLDAGLPDPYRPLTINGETLSATVFLQNNTLFSASLPKLIEADYLTQCQQIINLHQNDRGIDIQLVPVTFFWGRNPGKEGEESWFNLRDQGSVGSLHKAFIVLKSGKDHLVRFNKAISVVSLMQRGGNKERLPYRLARAAKSYFGHQKRHSIGPRLANRQEMIESVITQQSLQTFIEETAKSDNKSKQEIEKQCRKYLKEIGADFSYPFVRMFSRVLNVIWNRLYRGIEVNNAQAVRQISQTGAEIIYMPCHRSHADYLLMSYLLFEQGLVPPHIAAGVNLNFFPAGSVFRRCGAFFLRRSFKGEALYGEVFKAYYSWLFKKGYPIEFFTEGGRSRTGRLLPAKVGLLSMSLQTYLDNPERNVVIVPVYIGYDHIMEVSTYAKEMAGQKKQKENAWQVLGIVKKLGNFGRVFVNFGEPINVRQHIDKNSAGWQDQALSQRAFRQKLSTLADDVMIGINNASAVNALPLCAAILLSNKNAQVNRMQMLASIEKHQQLLALLSKDSLISYSQESVSDLYQQALSLNKFSERGDLVCASLGQAIQLNYYRNNIIHLFAMHALICNSIRYLQWKNTKVTEDNIIKASDVIYPFLVAEYFLDNKISAKSALKIAMQHLCDVGVLTLKGQQIQIVDNQLSAILIGHFRETYQRYQQGIKSLLGSLNEDENINWQTLDSAEHQAICKKQLSTIAIEPFDSKVNEIFLASLEKQYPTFISKKEGKLLTDMFYN